MKTTNFKKYKHLTMEDRVDLEVYLVKDFKLSTCAHLLGKDPSTISKEIKLNRVFHERNHFNNGDEGAIEFNTCSRLKRFPNVCNGCEHKMTCRKDKYYYRGKDANLEYKERLSFSRIGVDIDIETFDLVDKVIERGLDKGQSLYHIKEANSHVDIPSIPTLYRWVNEGYLSSGRLDLQRAVRYRPRVKRRPEPTNAGYREHRTYDHYLEFVKNNPNQQIVQMDTVESNRSSRKCLMTVLFMESSLLYAQLLQSQSQSEVIRVLDTIESLIGLKEFKKLFGCILTDNGSEFKNPSRIEFNKDGQRRTWLFYCDPGRSDQKGSLERHHSYIRLFLPKGSSFESLTDKNILDMLNNINSIITKKSGDNTAFKNALKHFNIESLNQLKMAPVDPKQVTLKPSIFKKK